MSYVCGIVFKDFPRSKKKKIGVHFGPKHKNIKFIPERSTCIVGILTLINRIRQTRHL